MSFHTRPETIPEEPTEHSSFFYSYETSPDIVKALEFRSINDSSLVVPDVPGMQFSHSPELWLQSSHSRSMASLSDHATS
jgi:hypothetical protein